MERYSTLYGAYTMVNDSGKKINQYIEIGRSLNLDDFLKSKNIPNPALAIADVNAALTGFTKLPGYDEQPVTCRPMLVRYAPMHLKRLDKYDNNVISFNSIACSAPDHQVGNRDGKYRNTHYIDRNLLLNAGEYNYLDQIFGTHLITWKENQDANEFPINYDALPVKVQPVQNRKDAMVVQMAAAALCNKAAVILKLEKDCVFQLRSMELLKQIYALLAPIQATEIGFASYEEPARIPQLIADTTIRVFVVPAEAELGALGNQPNMLVLDLNQKIKKPERTELLQAVSTWYKMEWKDRVQIMNVLFADMVDPNDANGYVERTLRYKKACDSMQQILEEKRDSIKSLEELKKLHDSFGDLMSIPMLYERFCSAAHRLIKLPQQYPKKTRETLKSWLKDELVLLSADAVMEMSTDAVSARKKRDLYTFGREVFKVNFEMQAAHEVGERRAKLMAAAKEKEFDAERKAIEAERAGFDKKYQAQGERYEEKLQIQSAEFDKKFQAQNAEYEAKQNELRNKAQEAIKQEQAKTAQVQKVLEQERADAEKKIQMAVDTACSEMAQEHKAELGKLNKRHQIALSDKDITIQQQKEELQQKDRELQQKDRENQQLRHGKVPMIRFCGLTIPEMAKSVVIFVALVGLVVGLVAGGVAGGFIGSAMAEPEPAKPAVTKPVETTVPVIDTKPVETTVPPTEPPLELFVDGEINWDYVYQNVDGIVGLEHEPADMEAALNQMGVTAEGYAGDLDAVMTFGSTSVFVTVQKSPAQAPADPDQAASAEENQNAGTSVNEPAADPDQTANADENQNAGTSVNEPAADPDQDANAEENQNVDTTTAPTEPELQLLDEMVPALVLDNGTYRIEAFYDKSGSARRDASDAAQATFRMLTDDAAQVIITSITDDNKTLDLHSLMIEVSGDNLWWKNGFELDLDKDARYTMQQTLGTGSEPIMLIHFEDESEAVVYDYSSKVSKLDAMVQLLEEKGYDGAYVDTIVIGLSVKEDTPVTDAEQAEQNPADNESQDNT